MEVKQIVLTEKCNLNCHYCYIKQKNNTMTEDIFAKLYETFDEDYTIDLFGGEPLINWKLIEFITEKCKHDSKCKEINLYSNGLLLDQNKVDFIRYNDINFIWSYDGLWAETEISHKVLSLVKQLTNFVAVQVGPPNLNMVENYNYFYNLGMLPTFTLMKDKRWSKIDILNFRTEMRKLCNLVALDIQGDINFVPKLIHITIKRLLEGIKNRRSKNWCGAGERMKCYMPDGDVYPCARFGTEGLRSDLNPYEECKNCDLDFFCDKGCYHQAVRNDGILKEVCELNGIIITCVVELNNRLKRNTKWKNMIRRIEEEISCTE